MCLTFAYLYNFYMYWLCMIATIPLATGNKLNCFINARGMLALVWHCVLLFCCSCVCFLLIFLHVNKSSSQKKITCNMSLVLEINYLILFIN